MEDFINQVQSLLFREEIPIDPPIRGYLPNSSLPAIDQPLESIKMGYECPQYVLLGFGWKVFHQLHQLRVFNGKIDGRHTVLQDVLSLSYPITLVSERT